MSHATAPIPTVYIVDDDNSVRESLSSLLRAEGLVVEVFASPLAFLAVNTLAELSCIVLDVRMPELDGFALQHKLSTLGREIPVIFISGHGDIPQAVRAMKAGAIDFLRKPFDDTDLLRAISTALTQISDHSEEKLAVADLRSRFDSLTPREKEILFQVAQGKLNKCIAHDLGVTESTVKVHRHNLMSKMRLRSLPELTRVLLRLKLQTPIAERDVTTPQKVR